MLIIQLLCRRTRRHKLGPSAGFLAMTGFLNLFFSWWRGPSSTIPSLLDISLDDIDAGQKSGTFTATDLVTAYIKRKEEVDHVFRSVLEINKDAVSIAEQLDAEAKTSGRRGPLHGVPFLLKDNIVTLDHMEATGGSYALLGAKPAHEATVVTKLREAGAIILGKATLTEWANYRWTNAATGWCARGGQCTGPFYPNMKASGSSTGSGVATALGLTFAALGTETDGSICNPAGKANLVGLKPTTGLVARDGVIPASNRLDTVGPFTRTVKDAATILTTIAGKSDRDPRTQDIPFDQIPDYAAVCRSKKEEVDLTGLRIGIPRKSIGKIEPDEARAFDKAIEELRSAGAEIVDNIELLAARDWESYSSADRMSVTIADMATSLAEYFKGLTTNPNNMQSLEDLIEFIKKTEVEEYPRYDVATFELAVNKAHYTSEKYKKLEQLRSYIVAEGGIEGALDRESLDVLVVPTAANTPVSFASLGGSPVIAVPLGFYGPDTPVVKDKKGDLITIAPGIPFPICFLARRFGEQTLLKVAHAFEKIHDKGVGKMYKVPETDLKAVVDAKRTGRKDLKL